tara:strand:- start:265 stop:387 length:123 start_codon:yes stop_codon:yes gene_type:complete
MEVQILKIFDVNTDAVAAKYKILGCSILNYTPDLQPYSIP